MKKKFKTPKELKKLESNDTLVTLIGHQGCGKTTLLELMQERLSDRFFFRPATEISTLEHTIIAILKD